HHKHDRTVQIRKTMHRFKASEPLPTKFSIHLQSLILLDKYYREFGLTLPLKLSRSLVPYVITHYTSILVQSGLTLNESRHRSKNGERLVHCKRGPPAPPPPSTRHTTLSGR
ncbi:hypothetical protein L9F63_010656, partial [Diploptera punctata]